MSLWLTANVAYAFLAMFTAVLTSFAVCDVYQTVVHESDCFGVLSFSRTRLFIQGMMSLFIKERR
jgi:hypothetical protein